MHETPLGAKILVVDDAPHNVKLLRVILKDAGYQVVEAFSGPEALGKLKAEKPDAMVLDVRMPGMTGYEVCQAVRQDPEFATMPVIMLTALSLPEERVRGIEAGATDFISKPFSKKELLARIKTSLALGQTEVRGVLEQLPEELIFTGADWKVLAVSRSAIGLLGLDRSEIVGRDFLDIAASQGVLLPAADPAAFSEPWNFSLQAADGDSHLAARHTPVKNTADRVVLRVIVLTAGS